MIKKGDWVKCQKTPNVIGRVIRVSLKKGWADVEWKNGNKKRMKVESLEVIG